MATKRRITQETFDEVVIENIEDLEMEPEEALEDAITQFEAQGVVLSNIMKRIPGNDDDEATFTPIVGYFKDIAKSFDLNFGNIDAKIECIVEDEDEDAEVKPGLVNVGITKIEDSNIEKNEAEINAMKSVQHEKKVTEEKLKYGHIDLTQTQELLLKIISDFNESKNILEEVTISGANGAVDTVLQLLMISILPVFSHIYLLEILEILLTKSEENKTMFHDFKLQNSASIILNLISDYPKNTKVLEAGFDVVRQAAAESEPNMQLFKDCDIFPVLLSNFKLYTNEAAIVRCIVKAASSITTPDDMSAQGASNASEYAKELVSLGFLDCVLEALVIHTEDPATVSRLAMVISHLAVNDNICKDFSRSRGIAKLLSVLNKFKDHTQLAFHCGSALIVLGRNDKNKDLISGASNLLVELLSIHREEQSVMCQMIGAISGATLRQPDNVDLFIASGVTHPLVLAMRRFPDNWKLQRWCCIALRNFVSRDRSKEHCMSILEEGVEVYARACYQNYNAECGDVAFGLIRDLGADLTGMTVGASLVHLGVGGEHLTGETVVLFDQKGREDM